MEVCSFSAQALGLPESPDYPPQHLIVWMEPHGKTFSIKMLPVGSLRKQYTWDANPAEDIPAGFFLKYLFPYEPLQLPTTPEYIKRRIAKTQEARQDIALGLRAAHKWLETHEPTKPTRAQPKKSVDTSGLTLEGLDL